MSDREREILHAELRGSTTEFLGWLTGMKPPEDKESIPPEMRGAFDRMVGRLQNAVARCANERLQENAKLRKVLGFYADEANYKAADPCTADGEFRAWGKQLNYVPGDKGERARDALSTSNHTEPKA